MENVTEMKIINEILTEYFNYRYGRLRIDLSKVMSRYECCEGIKASKLHLHSKTLRHFFEVYKKIYTERHPNLKDIVEEIDIRRLYEVEKYLKDVLLFVNNVENSFMAQKFPPLKYMSGGVFF